ncbi:MAG: lactate utilization protein B [Cytophagales bacterium]|nr:lactate utilization protein [Bernardetiaceae bacterium]MDW8211680.1 lactate utilization protein B [Cytophagales bacterium]
MDHARQAAKFVQNQERMHWHDKTLWFIRQKRDAAVKSIPEWETLRELASQIKANVLANLDQYLVMFEENATRNGIKVHWAANAAEHNQIVLSILQAKGAKRMAKSKSMLTEECHLNEFLAQHGIEVIDTDLGERVVQLAHQPPSHIVLPAIHMKKEEIGELFHEKLGTEKGASDPKYLTEAARQHLRQVFLQSRVALTGVNFAIAETGGFVVCTNEGNADMGAHLAEVHIASMGIEKIIPKQEHLGIFLRLLARSATGQPITTYSSHFFRPRKGTEMHIILVDNGRTEQLGRPDFRKSLYCIRCGACMNTCPVYRRSGGHSYGYTVPGPIGSILSPNVDMRQHATLPFASTLCGSCSDVCPVKIDIDQQLYKWRQIIAKEGLLPFSKHQGMKWLGRIFGNPAFYKAAGKVGRTALRLAPEFLVNNPLNTWAKNRQMPQAPRQSFHEWYLQHKNKKNATQE